MKNFFKSLLLGNTDKPESIYMERLIEYCPDAVSVEWFLDGRVHEAIFQENGQEKIIRLNEDGSLLDIRINLSLEELKESIRKEIELSGEIMSSILIQETDKTLYEFVLRDKAMKREIVFTDEEGQILRRRDFPELI